MWQSYLKRNKFRVREEGWEVTQLFTTTDGSVTGFLAKLAFACGKEFPAEL